MRTAMNALLGGIIDYAGLFPPARLPMRESVENYIRFLKGDEYWIVYRFICPTSRLDELSDALLAVKPPDPIALTIIGTGGPSSDAFRESLETDAKAMTEFQSKSDEFATIEAFEVKSGGDVESAVRALGNFGEIELYLEVPFDAALADNLDAIADSEELGVKGRTGGVDGTMFPDSERLSAFIANVVDLGLEFKLTAGLHEPVRHYDKSLDAYHHGFLNILAALLARDVDQANQAEMVEILNDDSAMNFKIGEDAFFYRDKRYKPDDIIDVRALFVGFGSCSVAEPLAGLERLGWMGALR